MEVKVGSLEAPGGSWGWFPEGLWMVGWWKRYSFALTQCWMIATQKCLNDMKFT